MPDVADSVRELIGWLRKRTRMADDNEAASQLNELVAYDTFVREMCNRASFAQPGRVLTGIVARYRAFRTLDGITEDDAASFLDDELMAAQGFDQPVREKLDSLYGYVRSEVRKRNIAATEEQLMSALYRIIARYYATGA